MLQFRVALIVFFVNVTKSLRPLRYGNVQPVKNEQIRNFQSSNDDAIGRNTDVASKKIQDIKILDDVENYSGEVFSSELDSNEDDKFRGNGSYLNFRRNVKPETNMFQKRMYHSSRSTGVTSSSFETNEFKEEWTKRWNELKGDALHLTNNVSLYNSEKFAMVAARPWNSPCGDPMQHDIPWGTCLISSECEAEYRIYRGDIMCGRSSLVCCVVERFRNDMNAAIDVSFADTSQFSTSSEEQVRMERGSKENKRRKRKHKHNLAKLSRRRQKRNIKKAIRKLVKEIRKQLSRAFRNNTMKRLVVMMNLKKLVRHMKRKFKKKRRQAIRDNDKELIKISDGFSKKISTMRYLNLNFLTNETFREIIVNGTIKKKIARQLLEVNPELAVYPEMQIFLDTHEFMQNNARRSGSRRNRFKPRNYLRYDLDYRIPHY